MNSPIVSVIMPVYNAETTLTKAIESFRNQSLCDWELIAVNDGSIDKSFEILKKYAAKDTRIVVIDKPNGGVASARQTGIERVRSRYVIHADSDDWVEPDMLEKMVGKAEDTGAEMVIADYFVDKPRVGSTKIIQKPQSLKSKDVLYSIYAKDLHGGLCHKLLLAAAYDKASARFIPDIDYCEDQLLLTQILSRLDLKIEYLPEAFYHYVMTENSLTRNFGRKGLEQMMLFNDIFPTILPDEPRFKAFAGKSRLDTFVMGFINRAYEKNEIKSEFTKVRTDAYKSYGLRWQIGFALIDFGLFDMARQFIKFK